MGSRAEWRWQRKNQWTGRQDTRNYPVWATERKQTGKKKTKKKQIVRDLWKYSEISNIPIIRVPKREERRWWGWERTCRSNGWKCPRFGKTHKVMNPRSWKKKAKNNTDGITSKKSMLRHIIIKLVRKTKKNLESSEREMTYFLEEKNNLTVISHEIPWSQKEVAEHVPNDERKGPWNTGKGNGIWLAKI